MHQVAVGVHEPGHDGPAGEVDDLFGAGDVHVAAPSGERDTAVAHDQRVDHGVPRIQQIDAAVGQQHRAGWGG